MKPFKSSKKNLIFSLPFLRQNHVSFDPIPMIITHKDVLVEPNYAEGSEKPTQLVASEVMSEMENSTSFIFTVIVPNSSVTSKSSLYLLA